MRETKNAFKKTLSERKKRSEKIPKMGDFERIFTALGGKFKIVEFSQDDKDE